eukprot:Awhi_evm1s13555
MYLSLAATSISQSNSDVQGGEWTVAGQRQKRKKVPQTEPLPGQSLNNGGGYSYIVSPIDLLKRFLVLGCEGGTYYVSQDTLALENASSVEKLVVEMEMGLEVVNTAVDYNVNNKAPKVEPSLFVLALCAKLGDLETRRAALGSLSKVCRIPTHLFIFVDYCQKINPGGKGWGRAMRRAISSWYLNQPVDKLAFQITKYNQRCGYSHRDLLRLCHANPKIDAQNILFAYTVQKSFKDFQSLFNIDNEIAALDFPQEPETVKMLKLLRAVEEMKTLHDANDEYHIERALALIQEFNLAREHLHNNLLVSTAIWNQLLSNMPMTAMLRNLGKMTSINLLEPLSPGANLVVKRLTDKKKLHESRIHPIAILIALNTYRMGRGIKGSLEWTPNLNIICALDKAFYLSFAQVQPTNKRFLLAMDVSGSMSIPVSCAPMISCYEASAALAMCTAKTEQNHHFVGFSHKLKRIPITASMSLCQVVGEMKKISMGSTDCSLPMTYAMQHKIPVDVFMVFTDSETYYGEIHPSEALRKYRRVMDLPNTKLIVMGMASNKFTIADPEDKGMLDIVGFDASAPDIVRSFVLED